MVENERERVVGEPENFDAVVMLLQGEGAATGASEEGGRAADAGFSGGRRAMFATKGHHGFLGARSWCRREKTKIARMISL